LPGLTPAGRDDARDGGQTFARNPKRQLKGSGPSPTPAPSDNRHARLARTLVRRSARDGGERAAAHFSHPSANLHDPDAAAHDRHGPSPSPAVPHADDEASTASAIRPRGSSTVHVDRFLNMNFPAGLGTGPGCGPEQRQRLYNDSFGTVGSSTATNSSSPATRTPSAGHRPRQLLLEPGRLERRPRGRETVTIAAWTNTQTSHSARISLSPCKPLWEQRCFSTQQ